MKQMKYALNHLKYPKSNFGQNVIIMTKQERLKSNIKLRVCVVENMFGQEYVWFGSISMALVSQNESKIIFGVSIYIFTPFVFIYISNFYFLHKFGFFLTDQRTDKERWTQKLRARSLKKIFVTKPQPKENNLLVSFQLLQKIYKSQCWLVCWSLDCLVVCQFNRCMQIFQI